QAPWITERERKLMNTYILKEQMEGIYEMNPLISIIVTVYNLENYIGECLESLVQQDFSSYEIVVVDNGSLDNSPEICRAYAERYPNRVRFVPLEQPSQLYRAHKAAL